MKNVVITGAANGVGKAVAQILKNVCPGLIQTDFYNRANNPLPEEIMDTGLTPEDVAKTVKCVFDLPHEITIPSIEVRHIKNY